MGTGIEQPPIGTVKAAGKEIITGILLTMTAYVLNML